MEYEKSGNFPFKLRVQEMGTLAFFFYISPLTLCSSPLISTEIVLLTYGLIKTPAKKLIFRGYYNEPVGYNYNYRWQSTESFCGYFNVLVC